MKTLFHLLFYKFFNHNKRIGNVNDDNFYAFKSVAFLSVLVFFNLVSLWLIYHLMIGKFLPKTAPIVITLITGAGIFVILHLHFIRKQHYKEIIESFSNHPLVVGKGGSWITGCYVIGTFVLAFGLAFLIGRYR